MEDPRYLIMDERAINDVDDAVVLACASDMKEALRDAKDLGGVIYDCKTQDLVWDAIPKIMRSR